MHKPPDRAPGIVADRIVAFGGIADEFTRIRHELAGDRVRRILELDEVGQRRREADRITFGDGLELPKPLRRGQSRFDKIFRAGQAAGVASQSHSALA
jgi:hypothetical protein